MRFPASDLFFRICPDFWKNLKQAQKNPDTDPGLEQTVKR